LHCLGLRKIKTYLSAALVSLLTLSLVFFPEQALRAAVEGMDIFWRIVFPSLLPFFVLSEVMLGLGAVHFIGVLLEPLMRPVFNVPGVGAFALSMGLAAGYPMDAVITGKFRRKGLCTQIEGERLLAFTNTADPLFIFGAVAVGMFGLPRLGMILAMAHYLSSFTVGYLFRFHRRGERVREPPRTGSNRGMLRRACRVLVQARKEDGRPFGMILGEAVKESVSTLLMIGGFIILFSVLVKILTVFGVVRLLTPFVGGILRLMGLSSALVPAFCRGFLEIDLGTMAASQAAAPLVQRAVMASAVIAWSGLSVHAQVASVLTGTDIRMKSYFVARLFHAVIAGFYTVLLLRAIPIALPGVASVSVLTTWPAMALADRFVLAGWQLVLSFGGLAVLAGLLVFYRRFQIAVAQSLLRRKRMLGKYR